MVVSHKLYLIVNLVNDINLKPYVKGVVRNKSVPFESLTHLSEQFSFLYFVPPHLHPPVCQRCQAH